MRDRLGLAGVIERISLQRFALPLRVPLATARGAIAQREGVLLTLEARNARGHGEAMPLPGWPGASLAQAEAWLQRAAPHLLQKCASDLLSRQIAGPPLARAALECALLDLAARECGVPLAASLAKSSARQAVPVNALLSARAPHEVAREAERLAASGYRSFKLKVGAAPLAEDVARVAVLREAIGAQARLRLDANGGWTEVEASAALTALARFAPEYVEEPVANIEACARLRARALVPIALDEGAGDVDTISHALALRACDVLVLKPALLGGPRSARAVAARAGDAGVDVVVTSFLDSAIGVAAALHCATTLPLGERACGLATGALLARDLATLPVEGGVMRLPAGDGLGVAPDPDALSACATAPRWEIAA
ncbi:MAG: o-succinylbenzoate synthase [Deltaproteobacteria bacterium]|nr:o-succinylbenzoate synthase [Deltaproteobacteria bacterium]